MKKLARTSAARSRDKMRGSASVTPKRPWDSVTGSWTPRAIQSVSASRSNVKAQAARASRGQRGEEVSISGFAIGGVILAQGQGSSQRAPPLGAARLDRAALGAEAMSGAGDAGTPPAPGGPTVADRSGEASHTG